MCLQSKKMSLHSHKVLNVCKRHGAFLLLNKSSINLFRPYSLQGYNRHDAWPNGSSNINRKVTNRDICLFNSSHLKFSHHLLGKANSTSSNDEQIAKHEKLKTEMTIRLINENGYLSWCRNGYLATVVGVAMITGGSTALSLDAGLSALFIATLNISWGALSHIINLIRLRQVSGMSRSILLVNILGTALHCFIWACVLILYLGFLDEGDPHMLPPKNMKTNNRDTQQK